jgi:hypothetical protein
MPGMPGMEKPSESKGIERAELICNGLWLKSVVNASYMGQPFEGVWLAGYDPFKKKYTGIFVSSMEEDGGACVFEGTYDQKTKTWNWTGNTSHGQMRSTHVVKDDGTSVETCYMKAADGKEAKTCEITRKRTSAAAPADASAKKAAPAGLSKEQEALQKHVGEWDATVKMTMAPGHPATEEKGTEKIVSACNGRWIWSDFKGQMQGAPFEGHALVGHDPDAEEYVCFWIDSMSPNFMRTSGTFDPAKKTGTFAGTGVCPTGEPMQVKEVITWKDDDTRIQKMEFKGPTPEMNGTMEITFKRKS